MVQKAPVSSTSRRNVPLRVEPLEHRALLNGSGPHDATQTVHGIQNVTIQVQSAYISQQSSGIDVTLVRAARAGRHNVQGPLTVDFSAAVGPTAVSNPPLSDSSGQAITPVNELVTFAAGQSTASLVIPIDSAASSPGLVPVVLSVGSPSRLVHGSSATVYLARDANAVPPSITEARVIRHGINLTFSKSMSPASVDNVHNYAVKFVPSKQFGLAQLTSVGLIQTLATTPQSIPIRKAVYNPKNLTVTLIPKASWPSGGSLEIRSPATLNSNRSGPGTAKPLADLQGNPINFNGMAGGAFAISISKGHPYTAAPPTLSGGN
jgi:hypothetical protein